MTQESHWALTGEQIQDPYHYVECGLDNVYLNSGYTREETPYGVGVAVKNVDGLHKAIGEHLVKHKKFLNGKELRFLRTQMDLTQSQLARLLGQSDHQVARWEKGRCKISGPAERLLRMIFQEHLDGNVRVMDLLEILDRTDERIDEKHMFEEAQDGTWRPAA